MARINAKRKKEGKRKDKSQRMKLPTSSQAIDALIGNEEQNRKKKKEKKIEIGSGPPAQLPWTIWLLLTTRMDNTVGLLQT